MRTQYYVKCICPICGRHHNEIGARDGVSAPWTGSPHITPRFNCKRCIRQIQHNRSGCKRRKMTKKQPTTQLGLSITRGLDAQTKAKNDLWLELESWKLRKRA